MKGVCFAGSEKGLQAICSLFNANPAAGLLPTVFDKTCRAGEASENGKATFALLFPVDVGDPNFTTGQANLLWGKGTSEEEGKAQNHARAAGGTRMGLECPASGLIKPRHAGTFSLLPPSQMQTRRDILWEPGNSAQP